MKKNGIPCTIMRGGTSKGLYLLEKDIPYNVEERNALLLRLMGSPDVRQIDGLGGASSVTSKVAIISPSSRDTVDVDYLFAQVPVDKSVVSYAGNCGNISSGVGPFAIEQGLVKATSPTTIVRIFNINTQKIIEATVQTPNRTVQCDGDFNIAGVPGTAAPVKMSFLDPTGSVFGMLLPTGNAVDTLKIPGMGSIDASIIDVSNPLVFVRAEDVGMSGKELPSDIDNDSARLRYLENVRGSAAKLLGIVDDIEESAWITPGIPKLAIMANPDTYTCTSDTKINGSDIDILGRMMSMQRTHPTYAMTGAFCTAAASIIPGSIVSGLIRQGKDPHKILIGHPGGILEAGVDFYKQTDGNVVINAVYGYRTARKLMVGRAFYQ